MARFFIYKKNVFKYLDNKKYYLMMTGWDKLETKIDVILKVSLIMINLLK